MRKSGQRHVVIDNHSIGAELQNFAAKTHRFGADSLHNDMWLSIDFDDRAFEGAVLDHVQRLIGRHYGPFNTVKIDHHC